MNAEKASTLRLLKEGIGNTVYVLESKSGDSLHEIRAHLPEYSESNAIAVLFLITSLAFLEATPEVYADGIPEHKQAEFSEVDGWTPADFLSHLRFEGKRLRIGLQEVRGRAIFTEVTLSHTGDLTISTRGRGQSALRWLSYVQGRSHLREA